MNNNFIIYNNKNIFKTKVYHDIRNNNQNFIIIRRREDLIEFIKIFKKYKRYNSNNIYFVLLDNTIDPIIINNSKNFTVKPGQVLFTEIDYSIPFIIPTIHLSKMYRSHTLLDLKISYINDIFPYSILIPPDGMCYYHSVIFSILIQILYANNITIHQRKNYLNQLITNINIYFNQKKINIYDNIEYDKNIILDFLYSLIINEQVIKYKYFLFSFIKINKIFIRYCKNMIVSFILDNLKYFLNDKSIEFFIIEAVSGNNFYKNNSKTKLKTTSSTKLDYNIRIFCSEILSMNSFVPSLISELGILPVLLGSSGGVLISIRGNKPKINNSGRINFNFQYNLLEKFQIYDSNLNNFKVILSFFENIIPYICIVHIDKNHYFSFFLKNYIDINDLEGLLKIKFKEYNENALKFLKFKN
jgi:hypothetical protein